MSNKWIPINEWFNGNSPVREEQQQSEDQLHDPETKEVIESAPPGFPEKLMFKLKAQYPGHPEKAFATAWKIHKQHSNKLDERDDVPETPPADDFDGDDDQDKDKDDDKPSINKKRELFVINPHTGEKIALKHNKKPLVYENEEEYKEKHVSPGKYQKRHQSGILNYRERRNLIDVPGDTMVSVLKRGPDSSLCKHGDNCILVPNSNLRYVEPHIESPDYQIENEIDEVLNYTDKEYPDDIEADDEKYAKMYNKAKYLRKKEGPATLRPISDLELSKMLPPVDSTRANNRNMNVKSINFSRQERRDRDAQNLKTFRKSRDYLSSQNKEIDEVNRPGAETNDKDFQTQDNANHSDLPGLDHKEELSDPVAGSEYPIEELKHDLGEIIREFQNYPNFPITTQLLREITWALKYERNFNNQPRWKSKSNVIYNYVNSNEGHYKKKLEECSNCEVDETTFGPKGKKQFIIPDKPDKKPVEYIDAETGPVGKKQFIIKRKQEYDDYIRSREASKQEENPEEYVDEQSSSDGAGPYASCNWVSKSKRGSERGIAAMRDWKPLNEYGNPKDMAKYNDVYTPEENLAHHLKNHFEDSGVEDVSVYPMGDDETPEGVGKSAMCDFGDWKTPEPHYAFATTDGQNHGLHVFKVGKHGENHVVHKEEGLGLDELKQRLSELCEYLSGPVQSVEETKLGYKQLKHAIEPGGPKEIHEVMINESFKVKMDRLKKIL